MARVSEYFQLGRTQGTLDFVDVDSRGDTRVFIDPRALLTLGTDWGFEAIALVQNFFETVLTHINTGSSHRARRLLAELREPNETHLGLSTGRAAGRALGWKSAGLVYDSLSASAAAQHGLLEHLEDTALLIPGIGRDIVSDMTTNIIRESLVQYTQSCCDYYGIPTESGVVSGPMWDPDRRQWYSEHVDLPVTTTGKLLLVPKAAVRFRMELEFREYYESFLLKELRQEEFARSSPLVEVLKNGGKRVTKKRLKEKYGQSKTDAIRETIPRPQVLSGYRDAKRARPQRPLGHEAVAEATGTSPPDLERLLAAVLKVPAGRDNATKYHHAVEALLSALFYPDLAHSQKEMPIHDGRKRIDITYTNMGTGGFFGWVAKHEPAGLIMVECKNYSRRIRNPELDQLAGRFGPSRGRVGLLVSRSMEDKKRILESCRDTARDNRGFIVPLDDDDLTRLVSEHASLGRADHLGKGLIRRRYNALIT